VDDALFTSAGRVLDNIDPEFFDDGTPHGPSYPWPVLHPSEAGTASNSDPAEEKPLGFPPRRSSTGNLDEGQKESRKNELDDFLVSLTPAQTRPIQRRTGLGKYFSDTGTNLLIDRTLSDLPSRDAFRKKVASMRTMRLPMVILQFMIRRDILRTGEDRHLLDLLPKGAQRRRLIKILASNGYSRSELDEIVHILKAETDQQRCERFLEARCHKPIWLFHFVIRPSADIRRITTFGDLMDYCERTYDGRREWGTDEIPRRTPMRNMTTENFCATIKYLAIQSMILDGRLLVRVSELVAQYIENMTRWNLHARRIFHAQCFLFNSALASFVPSRKPLPPTWYRPTRYYWEAQRNLLSMSASLDRPLIISKSGFRAVREVLAGLNKDAAEVRNSMRHAHTWPPYLKVGDGIDEMTDPEDNWSRSVSGGTLQQEAGYPLEQQDLVLDVLQGRAPDGTPTIQQRIVRPPNRKMGIWEATIRATRNPEEAWARFLSPPEPGMVPGVQEYGAMFSKLCQRAADPDMNLRPGDRAFSFPIWEDPNLSEFEKSRLRPPSVEKLYSLMRNEGIRPSGACLEILVANAPSRETGHKYLLESSEWTRPLLYLPKAKHLREVRTPLVMAYVKLLCNLDVAPGRHLLRAIQICDRRFEDDDGSRVWTPYAWGLVLRALCNKTGPKGHLLSQTSTSLFTQVRTYLRVADRIQRSSLIRIPTVVQFGKCLRKGVARALASHLHDMETQNTAQNSPMRLLYDIGFRETHADQLERLRINSRAQNRWLVLLRAGSDMLDGMIEKLLHREADTNKIIRCHEVESLERMAAREDPVRAGDAYEILATYAYLGDYERMASFLEWLVGEWSSPSILEQLEGYEEIPGFANFNDALCIFRRYAEPMLPEERVEGLRAYIMGARLMWTWPDDKVLEAFCEAQDLHEDTSYRMLSYVLEWTRYRQACDRGEDPATLLRPGLAPPEMWPQGFVRTYSDEKEQRPRPEVVAPNPVLDL
jgi:hypothetical protein